MLNINQALAMPAEIVVFDTRETMKNGLPRNFRDLSKIGLNAIASGQFSEDELQVVRKNYPNEKIIIVDLRRESHIFVNGYPISWRAAFDRSNEGKKTAEIIADEKSQITKAQKNSEIIVNKILEKDRETEWFTEIEPQIISVKNSLTEENLAKKYGFEYKRFTVRDHAKPDADEFKNIISFIKKLPPQQKVYVHCAAGKGRTTTFLTLLDIVKNGKNTSLENIFKRQAKIGGATLNKIDEESEWRTELAQERLKMIEDFYAKETAKK